MESIDCYYAVRYFRLFLFYANNQRSDRIHVSLNKSLGIKLTLPQVLEAVTWKGGREIAKAKREDGGPPIEIISDGTVF